MEVHGRQPAGDPSPSQDYAEKRQALERATRDRIRDARELLANLSQERQQRVRSDREASVSERSEATERRAAEAREERRRDVVEVSEAASAAAEPDPRRSERVEALRQEHQNGTLNSPERVERAAQRILEG